MIVDLVLRLTSPLSHLSDERAGNSVFFRRMKILHRGGEVEIPVISGNSFRGQLRRLAAQKLLDDLEISEVPTPLYHLLFSGGSISKGDTRGAVPIDRIRAVTSTLPFFGLLGGVIEGHIVPGQLRVGWVWPVCEATQDVTGVESMLAPESLLTDQFFTKHDDSVSAPGEKSEQMIFETELMVTGARLTAKVWTRASTPVEDAFLSQILSAWLVHPQLGGMSARGMGQLAVERASDLPAEDPYTFHLLEKSDIMREILLSLG